MTFHNVPAKLTALINDTTGTLIASAYVNPKTRIAVIFDTGCNAAYMERVGSIPKIKNLGIDDDATMGINCEWVGVPTQMSSLLVPTRQTQRAPSIRSNTHFFALEMTLAERQFFRALAKLVKRRAACPSACGIAAIVSKMGYLEEGCAIGADGSPYNVSFLFYVLRAQQQPTCMSLSRNTPASRIACMRACKISLAIKAGKCKSGSLLPLRSINPSLRPHSS